jgi:hypothetical protein
MWSRCARSPATRPRPGWSRRSCRPCLGRWGLISRLAIETRLSWRSGSTGSISPRAPADRGRGARRKTRSSGASLSGDHGAKSSQQFRCARFRPIIQAPSTRRSSSEPITGESQRWGRSSRAGRRGSLGFRDQGPIAFLMWRLDADGGKRVTPPAARKNCKPYFKASSLQVVPSLLSHTSGEKRSHQS